MTPLERVLAELRERPPTLGEGRLLCVDGPAGSGKTTLAELVAERVGGSQVLHLDDLYEGWTGLRRLDGVLDTVLHPLAEGRPGSYRRYDWLTSAYAETREVPVSPLLVVEGVGSGAGRYDGLRTLLVWVEAPHDERRRRGLERDGDAFAPHWEAWATDEARVFARERTRERADVVLDGLVPYTSSKCS